jgi:hypothetical protein
LSLLCLLVKERKTAHPGAHGQLFLVFALTEPEKAKIPSLICWYFPGRDHRAVLGALIPGGAVHGTATLDFRRGNLAFAGSF